MPQRIFYASHAVSVEGTTIQGAQSVSVNTNFNLEQVFQLGQLSIYDNVSTDPDVEITITKALDGHPLIWSLATNSGPLGTGGIFSNANDQCEIILAVGDDAVGVAPNTSFIQMTGCFITNISYTIPVDGNMTEEVQFIGSHKAVTGAGAVTAPGNVSPQSKILRRQHLMNGAATALPAAVAGKHISNISISASLNREKMYTLGQMSPFHRFVNFPLEVTCSFDVIATGTDGIAMDVINDRCVGRTANEEPICIELCREGIAGVRSYSFYLGDKCKLQSVNYSGGDTSGGNVTLTYTYTTFNDLWIEN